MRPREREEEDTPPGPPPPQPSSPAVGETPPPPAAAPASAGIGGGLSSMIVRPSESDGASDYDADDAGRRHRDSTPPPRRRRSSPQPCRRDSPPPFRRRVSRPSFPRRGSPPPLVRRGSPPAFHRRGPPPTLGRGRRYSPPSFHRRGSPSGFQPRNPRFNGNSGHGMHRGSVSPPRRQRLDDVHYDPDLDHSVGPHSRRGLPGRGRGARFQDVSPQAGLGRGGRVPGRGYNVPGRESSPTEEEYLHRNDPNLSPREGDWICQNPSCGNLNFARRSYCNNCNQHRFGSGNKRFSRSPRRGYYNSPPPYESPPRMSRPPAARGRRDAHGYRSPRRLLADDSGNFGNGSAPAARGEKLTYPIRREKPDFRGDGFLDRVKPDWPSHDEWNHRDRRRDESFPDRRIYDEPRAPSPHDRWVRESRERTRSPLGARPLKGSYIGGGHGDRRFRDSYVGRGQDGDLDVGRGRGLRQAEGSFTSRGRGHRPGMARGRNADIY